MTPSSPRWDGDIATGDTITAGTIVITAGAAITIIAIMAGTVAATMAGTGDTIITAGTGVTAITGTTLGTKA
jgi:hypothetical protein